MDTRGSHEELIVVLYDVSSIQRLTDFARLVYGLGYKYLVAARVYGAAAQSGVAEVMKLAFRLSKSFIVLNSVEEAVELFTPRTVIVFSHEYGERIGLDEITSVVGEEGRVMLVFGGSESSITRSIASMGRPVYFRGVERGLGPIAEAAIVLYSLIAREEK